MQYNFSTSECNCVKLYIFMVQHSASNLILLTNVYNMAYMKYGLVFLKSAHVGRSAKFFFSFLPSSQLLLVLYDAERQANGRFISEHDCLLDLYYILYVVYLFFFFASLGLYPWFHRTVEAFLHMLQLMCLLIFFIFSRKLTWLYSPHQPD